MSIICRNPAHLFLIVTSVTPEAIEISFWDLLSPLLIHAIYKAACIYAACRNTETPRTLDDVAKGINIRRKEVARGYRLIFRELDLKMPVVDPVKGISRIASIAGLSEKSKRKAVLILNQAKKVVWLQERTQWE